MYRFIYLIGCFIRFVLPGIELSESMSWQFKLFVLCGGIEAVLHIASFIATGLIASEGDSSEKSGCYTLMYIIYYLTTIPMFFYDKLKWWSIVITIVLFVALNCLIFLYKLLTDDYID